MEDVAPELLKKIQAAFQSGVANNKGIQTIKAQILSGGAYPAAINGYSVRMGMELKQAIDSVLSSNVLPDGKLYYNIAERTLKPMLEEVHNEVASMASRLIQSENEQAGIGLRAVRPSAEKDRIQGLLDKASAADHYDDVKDQIGDAAQNFAQHAADATIQRNAEFSASAGLSPKIVRIAEAGCCAWCAALAGTYDYPGDVPDDIYRRHERCNCIVEYRPGKDRSQDVWSKTWNQPTQRAERIQFSMTPTNSPTPKEREEAAEEMEKRRKKRAS